MIQSVIRSIGNAARLPAVALTVAVFASVTALSLPTAEASSEGRVQSIANNIVTIIKGGGSEADKTSRFRSAFVKYADINTMGTFALGKYASSVKGAQRQKYFSLIDDYVTRKFAALIVTSPVSAVKVTKSSMRGSDELVSSTVEFSDGRPSSPMIWRLRRGRIIDISFQGAWIVNIQKDVFTSIISRNNGDISALLKHMGG